MIGKTEPGTPIDHGSPKTSVVRGKFSILVKSIIDEDLVDSIYVCLNEKFSGFEMNDMTYIRCKLVVNLDHRTKEPGFDLMAFYDLIRSKLPSGASLMFPDWTTITDD